MCSCVQFLKSVKVKESKKLHTCYASEQIYELLNYYRDYKTKKYFFEGKFSFSDLRTFVKVVKNKCKIPIGSSYTRETNVSDGYVYDLCFLEEMDKLCQKYKLYYCEC